MKPCRRGRPVCLPSLGGHTGPPLPAISHQTRPSGPDTHRPAQFSAREAAPPREGRPREGIRPLPAIADRPCSGRYRLTDLPTARSREPPRRSESVHNLCTAACTPSDARTLARRRARVPDRHSTVSVQGRRSRSSVPLCSRRGALPSAAASAPRKDMPSLFPRPPTSRQKLRSRSPTTQGELPCRKRQQPVHQSRALPRVRLGRGVRLDGPPGTSPDMPLAREGQACTYCAAYPPTSHTPPASGVLMNALAADVFHPTSTSTSYEEAPQTERTPQKRGAQATAPRSSPPPERNRTAGACSRR